MSSREKGGRRVWQIMLVAAALLAGCGSAGPTVTPSQPPSSVSPSPGPSAQISVTPTQTPSATPSVTVPSSPPAHAAAWHATAQMITPHAAHTATLLSDGRVLVAGGKASVQDGDGASAFAELYDPTSEAWTSTGSMAQARWVHTATRLLDGRVLVVGGQSSSDHQLASTELYDQSTGRWTATGSMHKVRSGHTATLLTDGRVLVAGGYDFEAARIAGVEEVGLRDAELYDPSTGRWTATGRMTAARAGATATLLPDGRVLVAGGDVGSGPGRLAELYDPATGRWTATASMHYYRRDHTATLLLDGTVLVTGGFAGSGHAGPACTSPPDPCSAELYDPATGRWTATPKMHADRIGHSATLLPDGTVFVIGLGTYETPASAELYDPGTGRWTVTARPAKTRGLTATLLFDGTVLVTGDWSGSSQAAELYDPGIEP